MSCDIVISFVLFLILRTDKFLMQKKAKIDEEIMSGRSLQHMKINAWSISVATHKVDDQIKRRQNKARMKFSKPYLR